MALLAMYILRAVIGPTVWDRLLMMNLVTTKIIIITIFFASASNASYILDFAVMYALFGFIGTIFLALFLAERRRKKKDQ